MQRAGPQVVPGGREELERLPSPSCLAMANEEEQPSALSDNQVKVWETLCRNLGKPLPNAADPVQAFPMGPGHGDFPHAVGVLQKAATAASKGVPARLAQGFAGLCSLGPEQHFPGRLLLLRCLCVTHRALGAIRLQQSRRFLRGSPTPCCLRPALSSTAWSGTRLLGAPQPWARETEVLQ